MTFGHVDGSCRRARGVSREEGHGDESVRLDQTWRLGRLDGSAITADRRFTQTLPAARQTMRSSANLR